MDTLKFRKVFRNHHVVLPVIHVETETQALRNAKIAYDAGADGVFLINHSISWMELLLIHGKVADRFPGWWIGVNCLDIDPRQVFAHIPYRVSGIWVDNAMIQEDRSDQPQAEAVIEAQSQTKWSGLYFGGVAFKYQRHVGNLVSAAKIARRYMDVVTTSGPSTGQAAEIQKISTMKEALGEYPLAIASGITPNNVRDYLPFSDCYLVSTGISKTFSDFDSSLVHFLIDTIRSWSGHE
jgi:predicted TIM-barrel enzyme